MIQSIRSLVILLFAIFLFIACSPAPTANTSNENIISSTEKTVLIELTLNELKAYNGKNNMPAYIAYEGKVYDVTTQPKWTNGMHNGNTAGTDITESVKNAPHGASKIKTLQQVGILK